MHDAVKVNMPEALCHFFVLYKLKLLLLHMLSDIQAPTDNTFQGSPAC